MSNSDITAIEAVIRDVLYTLSDQESQNVDGRLVLPEDVPHVASLIYSELVKSGKIVERNSVHMNTSFANTSLKGDVSANVSILDIIAAFLKKGKTRNNRDA